WAQCHTRPLLMIPGTTELPFPVIQAMNAPPSIQYDRSFDGVVLEPTTLALRDVFQTKNEVILMPGSGRTALEAGALSVIEPGDRVLVVGAGQFGLRMREVMERRSKPARSFAYDLLRWREWWVPVSRGGKVPDGAPRRQPVSMPTHLTAAMNVAVRLILEEGLSHRFRRHEVAATALRRGVVAMGIEMFPDPSIVSNTVSCLKVPKSIDPAAVVTQMRDR